MGKWTSFDKCPGCEERNLKYKVYECDCGEKYCYNCGWFPSAKWWSAKYYCPKQHNRNDDKAIGIIE